MQNDSGECVDLYLPRKCSASNRIIYAKDHASIQLNIAEVDPLTGRMTGSNQTYAICGSIRKMGESDDCINRLAKKDGLLAKYAPVHLHSVYFPRITLQYILRGNIYVSLPSLVLRNNSYNAILTTLEVECDGLMLHMFPSSSHAFYLQRKDVNILGKIVMGTCTHGFRLLINILCPDEFRA